MTPSDMPTDEEIGRAVRPLLELVARALVVGGRPAEASARRLHQHGSDAELEALGISPRWLADEGRAGRIVGAVRGVRGWSATESAIMERLAARRTKRAAPAPAAKLTIVRDNQRELLVQAARRGAR